jgi:signal transduction histidine kinase
MQMALDSVMKQSKAVCGWILLFDEQGQIRDAYASGDMGGQLTQLLWNKHLLQEWIDQLRLKEQPLIWNNLIASERWRGMPLLNGASPQTAFGLPLMCDDALIGMMVLLQSHPLNQDVQQIKPLEQLASIAAHALANARQFEQMATLYQAQLEREKNQREWLAMAYHDLRGPLQNISASLSRVQRLSETHPLLGQFVGIALRSASQMTRMLKNLLDAEQLESNIIPLRQEYLNLANIMEDALDLVRASADEAAQTLHIAPVDAGLTIYGDYDLLLRVIVNLLENAIKHTPEGGQILLRAQMTERGVRVSVRDSGSGIPAQAQTDIFKKYVKLKHESGRDGYGLGLAFCRLAVEAHGGRIWVENDPAGGAVFAFVLPMVSEALAA